MMSAKGSGTVVPFYGAIDHMMAGERNWDVGFLQHAASRFPGDQQITDALEIALMPGDEVRTFLGCRHIRDRLSIQLQQHSESLELQAQLEQAEKDLAEAEAALPV